MKELDSLNYQEIGRNIRAQRMQHGLKQIELAKMINVSPQHISHIETARSQPSLSTLVAISNVLSVGIHVLLGSNLTYMKTSTVAAQISQIINGAPSILQERVLDFCEAEVKFHRKITELSN